MRLLILVIFASLAARCSGNCECSNFVQPNDRNEDVGNCQAASRTPYGPNVRICYLQGWSSCWDDVQSINLPGMWVSAAACNSVGPFRVGQGRLTEESSEDEIDKRLQQGRFFDGSDLRTVAVPALSLDELIKRGPQFRTINDEDGINFRIPLPDDRLQLARKVFDDSFEEEEDFDDEERMKQARF